MRPLSHSISRLLAATIVLVGVAAPVGAELVTTCGQEVSGKSSLSGDLDCTGFSGNAVTIRSGSLALNGFTITGGSAGIECPGACKITGPGTITGAGFGINVHRSLRLRGVDVIGNRVLGIQCYQSCRIVGPAAISNNGDSTVGFSHGIWSTGKVHLDSVTFAGNTVAAVGTSEKVLARNSVFSGSRVGIEAFRGVKLLDCTVSGNSEIGVSAVSTESVVGVYPGCRSAGKVLLEGTDATGNGTDAHCGNTIACSDVAACKEPEITAGSTCGTSYVNDSGIPGSNWGVCSGD